MKFHVRLDEIYYATQTFAGHFCLSHFRILKNDKFIVIKHDPDVAQMTTTKTGMLAVTMPED